MIRATACLLAAVAVSGTETCETIECTGKCQTVTCEGKEACQKKKITANTIKCQGESACYQSEIKAATTVHCEGISACNSPIDRNITADALTCTGEMACFTGATGANIKGSITVDGKLTCSGSKSCGQSSGNFKFKAKDIECSDMGCKDATIHVKSGGSVTCTGDQACFQSTFTFEDSDGAVTCENRNDCQGCTVNGRSCYSIPKLNCNGNGNTDCDPPELNVNTLKCDGKEVCAEKTIWAFDVSCFGERACETTSINADGIHCKEDNACENAKITVTNKSEHYDNPITCTGAEACKNAVLVMDANQNVACTTKEACTHCKKLANGSKKKTQCWKSKEPGLCRLNGDASNHGPYCSRMGITEEQCQNFCEQMTLSPTTTNCAAAGWYTHPKYKSGCDLWIDKDAHTTPDDCPDTFFKGGPGANFQAGHTHQYTGLKYQKYQTSKEATCWTVWKSIQPGLCRLGTKAADLGNHGHLCSRNGISAFECQKFCEQMTRSPTTTNCAAAGWHSTSGNYGCELYINKDAHNEDCPSTFSKSTSPGATFKTGTTLKYMGNAHNPGHTTLETASCWINENVTKQNSSVVPITPMIPLALIPKIILVVSLVAAATTLFYRFKTAAAAKMGQTFPPDIEIQL